VTKSNHLYYKSPEGFKVTFHCTDF